MTTGGQFPVYESWCRACLAVRPHLHGSCLACFPLNFPRKPRAAEQDVADQRVEAMVEGVFAKRET